MIINEISNLIEEANMLRNTALGLGAGLGAGAAALAMPATYVKNMVVNPIKGVGQSIHGLAASQLPGLIKAPVVAQAPSTLKNLKTIATIKGIRGAKNIYN